MKKVSKLLILLIIPVIIFINSNLKISANDGNPRLEGAEMVLYNLTLTSEATQDKPAGMYIYWHTGGYFYLDFLSASIYYETSVFENFDDLELADKNDLIGTRFVWSDGAGYFVKTGKIELYILVNDLKSLYSTSQYDAGFREGYSAGYDAGLDMADEDKYNEGYNDARLTYGKKIDDTWYTATEWGSEQYNEGYNDGLGDGALLNDEEIYNDGYNKGLNEGRNDKFYDGIEKWLVPAIIIVIVLGGILSIAVKKRDGE
jgi:hypothetical protein